MHDLPFENLRKANMFGTIPVLTRLYQLDNIGPSSEDRLWSEEVRAFCTEKVVERQCNLVVTDQSPSRSSTEPTVCKLEIFEKHNDLASLLVAFGFAEWIRT